MLCCMTLVTMRARLYLPFYDIVSVEMVKWNVGVI